MLSISNFKSKTVVCSCINFTKTHKNSYLGNGGILQVVILPCKFVQMVTGFFLQDTGVRSFRSLNQKLKKWIKIHLEGKTKLVGFYKNTIECFRIINGLSYVLVVGLFWLGEACQAALAERCTLSQDGNSRSWRHSWARYAHRCTKQFALRTDVKKELALLLSKNIAKKVSRRIRRENSNSLFWNGSFFAKQLISFFGTTIFSTILSG